MGSMGTRSTNFFDGSNSMKKIITARKGHIVLSPTEDTWMFLVLKTMQVERDHSRNRLPGKVYACEMEATPVVHTCGTL